MSSRNSRVVVLTMLVFLLTAGAVPLAAQISGAVFTADINGVQQNPNIFQYLDQVYFKAQGIVPDGTYYFQVTDPSGSVLLSSDNAQCRQVVVSGGVFTGVVAASGCEHVFLSNPGRVRLYPYDATPNPGHEYKAWLISQAATCAVSISAIDPKVLVGVSAHCAKTDNFKVRESCPSDNPGCDPDPEADIGGLKFYDVNANGIEDASDPGVPGFRIDVTVTPPGGAPVTTFTGPLGIWSLVLDSGATFRACEVLPIGWVQTGPIPSTLPLPNPGVDSSRCWVGTVGVTNISGLNFGNVCLGAGGGLTLGFWSNKNGKALFDSGDLAAMVSLNLRDASGAAFNPADYNAFRSWLLDANANNMAYMLSAQLAAMKLNVFNNKVSGGALIYAPGTASANGAGFATVDAIITEANTELGAHGLTLAGSPYRAYQEALKNALDNANNNRAFVQPGPCLPVTYTP